MKKQVVQVVKEQLVGVVVPGINRMCKEKCHAGVEAEPEPKWAGPCNRCQKKGLECVPYEG